MTSEVDICNLALTRVGTGIITTLDENSKAASLCRLHYPRARNACLRAHPWNFSIKRATLAQSSTAPAFEFERKFALPNDCLRVIRTDWEATPFSGPAIYGFPGENGYGGAQTPYRINGRFLETNATTVSIEYVAEVTDPNQFDELFTDMVAQRLAAEICIALTDNASGAKQMWDIYAAKVAEARLIDAQEGSPRDVVDLSGWIMERR